MKAIILLSLLFSSSVMAQEIYGRSVADDELKIKEAMERCQVIKTLLIKKAYNLDCFSNYHHYAPTSKTAKVTNTLRIANYNLLHPGTSKTMFKDYSLVAKIMNRYDLVSGLELLATVGRDEQNNQAVLAYLSSKPSLGEQQKARALYRPPGYLKVLMELKKLDPSWALILSPRGDSALVGSVEEMVGYFYRASVATPSANPHCKELMNSQSGAPFACFISLNRDFLGKDVLQHFARRPFMASFQAGNEKFTFIASHVVFTYSGDEETAKDMMKKTFGVEHYKELGTGINSVNFARFAEVKNTLDFMSKYRQKYNDEKIMFMADMNLVSNNAFWPQVLKSFPGAELLITDASTISPPRYLSNGTENSGSANDYDHFILNPKTFPACSKGEVYNYFKAPIFKDIESRYIIRQEVVGLKNKSFFDVLADQAILDGDLPPTDDTTTIELEYPLTPAGQSKMDKIVANFKKQLNQVFTVKRNEIVKDDYLLEERVESMRRRVFLRQLTNPYYHRYMQEVISDHFPASINCNI